MTMRELVARWAGRGDSRSAEQIDADIRDELGFHMEMLRREVLSEGAAEDEAARLVAERFGDVAALQRACRGVAMKERIMMQRVNMALLVAVAAGLAWSVTDNRGAQRAQTRAMNAMADRLERLSDPARTGGERGSGGIPSAAFMAATHFSSPPSPGEPFRELAGVERPKVPELSKLRCFDTPQGWVFCADEKEAAVFAEDLREATASFKKYFGSDPVRGAVYAIGGEGAGEGDAMASLRAAGAKWVMPWFSPKAPLGGVDMDSIRKQIARQLQEQGLGDKVDDKAIKEQTEAIVAKMNGGEGEEGYHPLRHELGHIWFIREFWGDAALGEAVDPKKMAEEMKGEDGGVKVLEDGQHYGGPAADWLDETAAILMEDPALTRSRREGFARTLEEDADKVIPLEKLFTMEHPVSGGDLKDSPEMKDAIEKAKKEALEKAMKNGKGGGGGGTFVTTITVPIVKMDVDASPGATEAVIFYDECRSLADYLLEKTGKPLVFREIAQMEAVGGGGMARWLSEKGSGYGLGANAAEVQKDWLKWAKKARK